MNIYFNGFLDFTRIVGVVSVCDTVADCYPLCVICGVGIDGSAIIGVHVSVLVSCSWVVCVARHV